MLAEMMSERFSVLPPVDAGVGVGAGAGVAAAGTGKIGSGDGVELWVGTAAGMD